MTEVVLHHEIYPTGIIDEVVRNNSSYVAILSRESDRTIIQISDLSDNIPNLILDRMLQLSIPVFWRNNGHIIPDL